MKEKYSIPEIEIISVEFDVLVTSGCPEDLSICTYDTPVSPCNRDF